MIFFGSLIVFRVPGRRPPRSSVRRQPCDRTLHATASERNTLHGHRGFDAAEASKDHCGVNIAEMPDAKCAARKWSETTGNRNFEALARDAADSFRIDALAHRDGRHRHRA